MIPFISIYFCCSRSKRSRSAWDSRGETSGYEQLEISGDLVYGIQTFTQDEEYLRLIAQVKAWFCVMDE